MRDDLVQLRIESDDFSCDDLQVFELAGRESLGQLFALTIGVVTTKPGGLDLAVVEGATATLVLEAKDQEVRRIHGMIAEIRDRIDTEPDTHSYFLLLVPRAHRLTLVRTQEIFMDLTVPEIIQKKLDLVGLGADDVQMRLSATYPKREFVVQYKETDLAFISRLAEREGITFFFEHEDGVDRIVFTDDNTGFHVAPGHEIAPFRARGERRDVFHVEATTRLVPKAHVVHDYNYRNPSIDLTRSKDAPSGLGGGIVEYGAHCKTPEESERLALIRAQETEATHRVFSLESDLGWIRSGGTFTLEGHPKLGDTALLVTEIEHAARPAVALFGGKEHVPYTNRFRAIEAATPFRPPRVTPLPKIHGVINGVVAHEMEGTESIFARLDDEGRYLVRFMFDMSPTGERPLVSRRIRMAQPHSGAGYGHHHPLKPGTEVLVGFIDGDPDRPIILHTVPNTHTASPVGARSAAAHRIKTATGILIEMKDAIIQSGKSGGK
ncbi:type VI secretion system Vgr family protein [Polyangium aurulentum]|uniref:type VI secretion system Vgr family protein n=1 Tax=Polyangium aurulentum TaxID=2567896 RepID=UPI0010AE5E16|nr:type VI secretion system tip protein TssI/VgrG [Polyangium aurulentum]UQA55147.1 type VI secretion system tip protein VgrG [Polyangium aurulentum]